MTALIDEIRERLQALQPLAIDLRDDSAKHAGHAGAAAGGGHFKLRITSAAFDGQSRLARHREVYALLGDLIPHRIHALAIDAQTPLESELPRRITKPEEPHES
ncbi:BolA family transcriptional regulator [Niveibacterium sp. 24ML]|uniref:BolA family protein n=1 Tax=Niveibacterium sp. 24ML TaxID=2985512 RepID=UPI00226F6D47|nr:BolA family protein [Niveibacterium sp. 24ML]MCX9157239.1 BolA family transcriptional regulator [Niveibacterium sp. 24ML]